MSPVVSSGYLEFVETGDTGKTKVWHVYSTQRRDPVSGYGNLLAVIKWYGPWRQYAQFPEPRTIWNSACLADVESFLHEQMTAWRKERSNAAS